MLPQSAQPSVKSVTRVILNLLFFEEFPDLGRYQKASNRNNGRRGFFWCAGKERYRVSQQRSPGGRGFRQSVA